MENGNSQCRMIALNSVVLHLYYYTSIVKGERDLQILARYRESNCKKSIEEFERSLQGNYREEHVFALKQAIEMYDFYNQKIRECEQELEKKICRIEASVSMPDSKKGQDRDHRKKSYLASPQPKIGKKLRKHEFSFDIGSHLQRITGTNLTAIPGIGEAAALIIISEMGGDIRQWKNSKHLASWLGLCPKNKISGGKVLHSRTRPGSQRIAWILRMCAVALHRSKTAMGAHLRRLKSRLGGPKAITAVAHKLAKLLYNMLRYGTEYVERGQEEYEKRYQVRRLKGLEKAASPSSPPILKKPPKFNVLNT